jgi:phosphate:Na+ symporter
LIFEALEKTMDLKLVLFSAIGGLALFIYGMRVLSAGLQMAFGEKLKAMPEKITDNKLHTLGIGAVITAIVQSSGLTTITMVGLINSGMVNLMSAASIIMGANIGTTLTTQLVAFRLDRIALPLIALGVFLSFICKSEKWKYRGQILTGFGILFLGMSLMTSEIKKLAEDPTILNSLAYFGRHPVLGIMVSAVFAGIIRSSSAASGLAVSMGMSGIIDLNTAITFILGANIGTTITVILASFRSPGSTIAAKRAALIHVFFNVFGVLLVLPFIAVFKNFIDMTSSDLPRQIANAHTVFNIMTSLILLPLFAPLIKTVSAILPGEETCRENGVKYLDNHVLDIPAIALGMAEKEVSRMLDLAASMINCSREALFEKSKKDIEMVRQKERLCDELDNKVEIFMSKINKETLSKQQQAQLAVLLHGIADIERIADHAHNICELASLRIDKKIKFSEDAFGELNVIFDKANTSVDLCRKIIGENNPDVITEILALEKQVDNLVNKYENNHLVRLEQRICVPEAGPVYVDILRNLERITDHTHNVAYAKRFGF